METEINYKPKTNTNVINSYPVIMRHNVSHCLYMFYKHDQAVIIFNENNEPIYNGPNIKVGVGPTNGHTWSRFSGKISISQSQEDDYKITLHPANHPKVVVYKFPILMKRKNGFDVWKFYNPSTACRMSDQSNSQLGGFQTCENIYSDMWEVFTGEINIKQ